MPGAKAMEATFPTATSMALKASLASGNTFCGSEIDHVWDLVWRFGNELVEIFIAGTRRLARAMKSMEASLGVGMGHSWWARSRTPKR